MASTADMNIVLGQGNAVKEVQNVRKQNLELNQQFVAQQTEEKKKEDRVTVQEFEDTERVEHKADEEKKGKEEDKKDRKGSQGEASEEQPQRPEGNLIDIKV